MTGARFTVRIDHLDEDLSGVGTLPDGARVVVAGAAPGDVNQVVFTHLHGDHTGWNIDRTSGKPLFANARYHVPKGDWDHYSAQDPQPESFVRDVQALEAAGCMNLIEGEYNVTSSLLAVPTPGHTPGHTSVALTSGGERGFILGDVVLSPIDAEEPDLDTSFDWDHDIARETRRKIIDRLAGDRSLVGASHLPAPGLGHFVRLDNRTKWQALP